MGRNTEIGKDLWGLSQFNTVATLRYNCHKMAKIKIPPSEADPQ